MVLEHDVRAPPVRSLDNITRAASLNPRPVNNHADNLGLAVVGLEVQCLPEVAVDSLNTSLTAGVIYLCDHVSGLSWDIGILLEGGEDVGEAL